MKRPTANLNTSQVRAIPVPVKNGDAVHKLENKKASGGLAGMLRLSIKESGKSANALALAIGVPQPTITRFLSGSDIRISRAEKLAAYFGLELRKVN